MKNSSTIEYDSRQQDFLINGKPLLAHLEKHEGVARSDYTPAIGSQLNVTERLSGIAPPDLQDRWVAIYLCGHCGGYDGNPIGVKVEVKDDSVDWVEMGWYSDMVDFAVPFKKIREYTFDKKSYNEFIIRAKWHDLKD